MISTMIMAMLTVPKTVVIAGWTTYGSVLEMNTAVPSDYCWSVD